MSYSVEKLEGVPVVHYKLGEDYDIVRDSTPAQSAVAEAVEAQAEPVYVIFDFTEVNLGLDDVIQGANMLVSGVDRVQPDAPEAVPIFDQPNTIQVIMVTSSKLIRLAARGMNSPVFGNQDVHLSHTLEEALEYVRSSLVEHA